ncbi:DNA-3-methyladenine glycosylase family protein [Marinithermus hydrothermalis]|uniref:DNA-3-methyladenine glycosylase II n=1 Tax=Marinithermus hydrothermalis (strain DSM 14884 / JCM 11576 / T1) TaxID=869210 RepID=F2NR29_MARHT|nr:DNA-3-methyladenine glycosylase [Marinithermus hydrothermalis]AEB12607.1 HhH-GPD family protein [Marinithermus hydrothermalis DSM 14884]
MSSEAHLAEVTARPEVLAALQTDPVMAALVARHGPYRWGLHPPYATLVRAIVGQQLSNAAARTIYARLKARVGLDPAALLAASEASLRAVGLSRVKIGYLRGLARFALEGGLEGLEALPDAEVARQLGALKGVGPWTVEMLLIFGLGRMNVWPVADLGLARQARALYGVADRAGLVRLGERFQPYRSAAAWYLWAEADGKA